MTVSRSFITNLLRPGLLSVFFDFMAYPELWKEYFTTVRSDKGTEYDMEMMGSPIAQIKREGGPVFTANVRQYAQTAYENQTYAIALQFTREMIDDNQYPTQFPLQAQNLKNSLLNLKNINAMLVFNNGFNELFPVSDGQPLFSTQHPVATQPVANRFTNGVQLQEFAVEDAITLIKGWLSASGLNMDLNVEKLLVPQKGFWQASRILDSRYQPDTANNAINPLVQNKFIAGGSSANIFLKDPDAWYLLTNEPNGFKHMKRSDLNIAFITDDLTDNVTVRTNERYSFGCSNWRAAFGSQGS